MKCVILPPCHIIFFLSRFALCKYINFVALERYAICACLVGLDLYSEILRYLRYHGILVQDILLVSLDSSLYVMQYVREGPGSLGVGLGYISYAQFPQLGTRA
jgi:hypothetical protein